MRRFGPSTTFQMIRVPRWIYECSLAVVIEDRVLPLPSVRGRRRPQMKATAVAFSLILLASTPALGEPGPARTTRPAPHAPSDGDRKAEASFAAEVLVLHATNTQKGIDARIGSMPELKKPPFSSYDSYELLDRARLTLDRQSPKTLKLANGRVLETRLVEVLGKDLVRLSASINQPGGKEFLPLLEVKAKVGQAFIVAGQRYKQGILVLVLRVTH